MNRAGVIEQRLRSHRLSAPAPSIACTTSGMARLFTPPLRNESGPRALMTAWQPATARSTASAEVTSPWTTSTRSASSPSRDGSRTSTATVCPAASAASTAARPVPPVAPSTQTLMRAV